MLEELLKAILGGASAQPSQSQSTGDPTAEMLESILGGGASAQQDSAQAPGGDMISGLLEAILGGGMSAQQGSTQAQGGDVISSLLEAIMGGALQGTTQQQDSMGALGGSGTSSFLGTIIAALAQKIGLPPQLAQLVVSFVLKRLLSGAAGAGQSGGYPGGGLLPSAPSGDEGLNLDGLLEQMGRGQTVDLGTVRATGMAEELSRETGLSPEVAEASLEEVLNMLSGQMSGNVPQGWSPQPSKPGSLEDLLDTW